MARANLHLDLREWRRWAKSAPGRAETAMRRALPRGGYLYSNLVKRKMSGPVLKRRTGNLVRSVTVGKVEGSGLSLRLRVGSNMVYAPIHEFGGVVKPKKSKYLAIPLKAALTAAGVPRFRPRNAGGSTFVRKSKRGNLIIFRNDGGQLTPLFVLKASVRIPARPIWRPSIEEVRPDFTNLLVTALSKEMRR